MNNEKLSVNQNEVTAQQPTGSLRSKKVWVEPEMTEIEIETGSNTGVHEGQVPPSATFFYAS